MCCRNCRLFLKSSTIAILSDVQRELYHSYAESAREELSQLVKKEGFDKVQIHVLATLTRLKQICCHPAIFAKEKAGKRRFSKI